MAFVCQSDRKLTQPIKSLHNIGPGYYQTINIYKIGKTVPSTAPFNSSTVKRSIYDKEKIKEISSTLKIGPGTYNLQNPFAQKNIKTFVNDHSVIVKINSLQTPQFKSSVPRFKSLQTQIPGPGFYQLDQKIATLGEQIRKNSIQKRKLMKQKLYQFVTQLKKNDKISSKPSIPSNGFSLDKKIQSLKQNKRRQKINMSFSRVYDNYEQENKLKNKKGFTWTKTERKIFPDGKKNLTERNIGPGMYFKKYNNNQNQKLQKLIPTNNKFMKKRAKTQTSTFKTKYVRTFFDQLYYETISKEKATIRQEQKFKTDKPGPGDYEIDNGLSKQIKRGKNNVAYQFFGSTVARFSPQKILDTQPEKKTVLFSFYDKDKWSGNQGNLSYLGQKRSFNKKYQGFLSTNQKKTQFIKDDENIPGPGEYEITEVKSLFKPKKGKKVQNFGFSQQRFPVKIPQFQLPEEMTKTKEEDFLKSKKKKVNESFMFKSKVNKQTFQINNSQSQTFGKYNVNQTDLGTKLQKKTMFLQNLRKIDVEIPAFNSSIPRFLYDKQSKSLDTINSKQKSSKKEKNKFLMDAKKSMIRDKLIEKNRQQAIQSKKSMMNIGQSRNDRFENLQLRQKFRNPGVGDYSLRSNWMKQSYNVKYQKNNINQQKTTLATLQQKSK